MISSTRTFLLFLLIALCFHSTVLKAEEQQLNDQQIRSAIVYNISKYVTWPGSFPNDSQPFIVGIIGQGRSSSEWASLQGKIVHGRKIVVQRFSDFDELVNCQLIFIEQSERKNVPRILAALKEFPVLTISEIEGFSQNNGMITLRVVNYRMTFEVNLKSARASGLDISSNLLKLATEVVK